MYFFFNFNFELRKKIDILKKIFVIKYYVTSKLLAIKLFKKYKSLKS